MEYNTEGKQCPKYFIAYYQQDGNRVNMVSVSAFTEQDARQKFKILVFGKHVIHRIQKGIPFSDSQLKSFTEERKRQNKYGKGFRA